MFGFPNLVALAAVGAAGSTASVHAVAPSNTEYCGCNTTTVGSDDPKAFSMFVHCVSNAAECTESFDVTDTVTHTVDAGSARGLRMELPNIHTENSTIDLIRFTAKGAATGASAIIYRSENNLKLDMTFQIENNVITLTPTRNQPSADGALIVVTTVGDAPDITKPVEVVYGLHRHETSGTAFNVGSAVLSAGAAIYATI